MEKLEHFLAQSLEKRRANGNLRSLEPRPVLQDYFSNDYLGLSRNPFLAQAIRQREETLDFVQNGATGSRLLSGNSLLALQVEARLAMIFKTESALIFNSGYAANTAVLSSIPQKGDTIIYDELAHTSLKDGARLSLALRFSFKHNNLDDLALKIQKGTGRIYVVVESVYSMDGDFAPLLELATLCNRQGCILIVDEAHTTGIWGEGGSGLVSELGLTNLVPIRIFTFGKALGVHGAAVAGSKMLTNYLVNFARPFIYSTAMPPHGFLAIDCAFYYISKHPELAEKLKSKIQVFRKNITVNGLDSNFTDSHSPIQILKVSGNENALQMAEDIRLSGYDVRAVLSPTVAKGSERIRICLHTFNTERENRDLLQLIGSPYFNLILP